MDDDDFENTVDAMERIRNDGLLEVSNIRRQSVGALNLNETNKRGRESPTDQTFSKKTDLKKTPPKESNENAACTLIETEKGFQIAMSKRQQQELKKQKKEERKAKEKEEKRQKREQEKQNRKNSLSAKKPSN